MLFVVILIDQKAWSRVDDPQHGAFDTSSHVSPSAVLNGFLSALVSKTPNSK